MNNYTIIYHALFSEAYDELSAAGIKEPTSDEVNSLVVEKIITGMAHTVSQE